jgi:hypothetical protein
MVRRYSPRRNGVFSNDNAPNDAPNLRRGLEEAFRGGGPSAALNSILVPQSVPHEVRAVGAAPPPFY